MARSFVTRNTQTVTPVIGGTYAVNDQIGGVTTVYPVSKETYQSGAIISSITLVDKGDQRAQLDVLLFGSDPSGTISSVDNDAFAISDTGLGLVLGKYTIFPIDYIQLSGNAVATINVDLPYQRHGETELYMVIVSRAAPTYSLGDLVFKVHTDARE